MFPEEQKWPYIPFENALIDSTGGQKKIQKKEYPLKGFFPVIDQGQNLIAGYIDNAHETYKGKLPVILFGDHTRIFKFIDFSFALGADGVKVLTPKSHFDPKFLYYYLTSIKIPSRGYSRHYKFLKEIQIPFPPLSEQRRIVEILDQADALRKKRAEADEKASKIIPALFYQMFRDPATNTMGWNYIKIKNIVKSIERRDPTERPDEKFIYIDISGIDGNIGKIVGEKSLFGFEAPGRARQVIKTNDVIISTVRPYLRATALVTKKYDNQICSTGFCVLRSNQDYGYGFIYALTRLPWFTQLLNDRARGASYPAVTDRDILDLNMPYPSNERLLKDFDSIIEKIFSLQDLNTLSKQKVEHLFGFLLNRAFSGELTLKWRESHMKELLVEMEKRTKYLIGVR